MGCAGSRGVFLRRKKIIGRNNAARGISDLCNLRQRRQPAAGRPSVDLRSVNTDQHRELTVGQLGLLEVLDQRHDHRLP